jgi:hypothetical protein
MKKTKFAWQSPSDRDILGFDKLLSDEADPDSTPTFDVESEMSIQLETAPYEVMEDVSFEDGIDLSGMWENHGSDKAASLQDLSWLEDSSENFENFSDPNDIVPELEAAWLRNQKRATGLLPNKGALRTPQIKETPLSPRDIVNAVRHASRRSHFGDDLEAIGTELAAKLGKQAPVAEKAWRRIASEHGLVGRVFIRESSFPGLRRGEWVKELKKFATSAAFVLTEDSGVAAKLGKQAVTEIPWKKAYTFYAPRLTAAGFRVASGDPKKALQKAFLTGPVAVKPKKAHSAFREQPSSVAEVRRRAKDNTESLAVVDFEHKAKLAETAKYRGLISKMASFIPKAEMEKLLAEDDARNAHRKAMKLLNRVSETVRPPEAPAKIKVASEFEAEAALLRTASRSATAKVQHLMNQGVVGSELDAMIPKSDKRFAAKIASVRTKHEGLSGFLYVDAGAYVNKLGWNCDEGALVAKASSARYVRPVAACAKCPLAVDGSCLKFAKPFLEKLPKNAEALRQKNLKPKQAPKARVGYTNPVEDFGLQEDGDIDVLATPDAWAATFDPEGEF